MKRRRKDSGFALLLVFLMAAIIGITLYAEIPRVAFNAQRQKEQMLIERGEQYKIAIRRFVQANKNRWPASMDELESFNNRHFLRHRYKDPITGKDEWRLVHIQNGVLTDSKTQKKPTDQTKTGTQQTFIQEMAGLGTAPAGPNRNAAAMRQRPSDANAGNLPGNGPVPTDPNNPNPPMPVPGQVIPPGQPMQPGYPVQGGYPGQPGVNQPYPQPGNTANQPQGNGGFITNMPGLGSSPAGGVTIGPNGQPIYPGQQQYPGMPVNSQTGGVSPYPVTPGVNGAPGQPNQAANLINNLLTSPRPGGFPGAQPGGYPPGVTPPGAFQPQNGPQGTGAGNSGSFGGVGVGSAPGAPVGTPLSAAPGATTIGGGIAGVASTADADSIMTYADHTNYSEWEFIFDPTKWHQPPNPNAGPIGTSAAQLGSSVNNLGPSNAGTAIGPGMAGQATGQPGQPGQQMGTGGMPGANSQFGAGGLPDIRPGRR
jgi:type II secretory pathway pseudopilin PulG